MSIQSLTQYPTMPHSQFGAVFDREARTTLNVRRLVRRACKHKVTLLLKMKQICEVPWVVRAEGLDVWGLLDDSVRDAFAVDSPRSRGAAAVRRTFEQASLRFRPPGRQ